MKRLLICMLIGILAFSTTGCNFFGHSGNGTTSNSGEDPGGDDGPTADSEGFFIDSGVYGLKYTASPSGLTGTTDADGRYEYVTGDTITFSLGDIVLGSSDGAEYITPVTLFPDDENMALNLAQFLQSIDDNGDPTDGITPNASAVEAMKDIDFRSESGAFETFLQSKLPSGLTMVAREQAMNHMETTFNTYAINPNGHNHTVPRIFPGYDSEHGLELWITKDGKDFNFVKELDNGSTLGSSPDKITKVGSKIFYTARTPEYGRELWVTDGTTAGTKLVKDITPGSDGTYFEYFIVMGDKLIFTASTDDYSMEPWVSDGTEAGTFMLKDINSGDYGSYPADLTLFDGKIFFTATSKDESKEVWSTDGTTAGTKILIDYNTNGNSEARMLTVAAGSLWYRAVSTGGTYDLVKSDGTTGGTAAYESNIGISDDMVAFRDKLYYFGSGKLNYTDGSSTTQLVSVVNGSNLTPGDTVLYLLAQGASNATLHKTDGVTTDVLTEIQDSNSQPTAYVNKMIADGDKLYFVMNTNEYGEELYAADGSTFTLVKDIEEGSDSSYIDDMAILNNKLYFSTYTNEYGRELWVSDGTTAGTNIVKDINEGSAGSYADDIVTLDNKLYFSAADADDNNEIWVSDGTEAGTEIYIDTNILPASGMSGYNFSIKIGENFVFASDYDIWVTDGTADGTVNTGYTSDYSDVNVNMGDYVVILLTNESGDKLLKTDGTVDGTSVIETFEYISKDYMVRTGDKFIFYGYKTDGETSAVYVSDGTADSAERLLDSEGNEITDVEKFITTGGKAFIKTYVNSGSDYTYKFYTTDGTPEGTKIAEEQVTTDSNINYFTYMTAVGDLAYYINDMGTDGYELWSSDGTASGKVFLKTISEDVGNTAVSGMIDVDGTLYFIYRDSNWTDYLWKSDGTPAGTVLVKDFYATRIGYPKIYISPLAIVDNKFYFMLRDGVDEDNVKYSAWVIHNKTGMMQELNFGDIDLSTYRAALFSSNRNGIPVETEYVLLWLVNGEDGKGQLLKVLGSSVSVLQQAAYIDSGKK